MTKSVTFLLPGVSSRRPIGGYKIIYEYANRLADDNWDVSIVYSLMTGLRRGSLWKRFSPILRYPAYILLGTYHNIRWFKLKSQIKQKLTFSFSTMPMRQNTIYVATAIQTSFALAKRSVPQEHKAYFVQSFENWDFTDSEVYDSYRLPLHKITIAKWLQSKIREAGSDAQIIPNGFSNTEFYMTNDIDKRSPLSLSMLYHKHALKGCDMGLKVIEMLKNKYTQLSVTLFGTPTRPEHIPSWITYCQCPAKSQLRQIYNESSIYLATSSFEGWGLTVGEAALCGCAIAATDIDGYKEMIADGDTALLSPVGNAKAMYDNVVRLIEDSSLRVALARSAQKHLQQFSYAKSYDLLKQFLEKLG